MGARKLLVLASCAFLSLGGGLFGQPPAETGRRTATPQQIDKWIGDLDHDKFALREEAQRELLRLEARALAPLRLALKKPHSLEFRCRAEKLLTQLAIFAPGGEVVGGLKLCLALDRDRARRGDTIVFTTTLVNMTDKPMNLEVGYSTCGNYFECGAVLKLRSADDKDQDVKWVVGFCGTGATALLRTLPAKSIVQFQLPAKLLKKDQWLLSLGRSEYTLHCLNEKGMNTFRVVYQQQGGPPQRPLGSKVTPDLPALPDAAYWGGTVQSNEVTLKIVP
jgi:hypothetical protein